MLGPALVYPLRGAGPGRPSRAPGRAGHSRPCAPDFAFSAFIARRVFGSAHPALPFLLLLAIADDALGLVVLALFYPVDTLRPSVGIPLLGAALVLAYLLRRNRVLVYWPYILAAGAMSWIALFRGGLHPALALVPISPFLPHAARDRGQERDDRHQRQRR